MKQFSEILTFYIYVKYVKIISEYVKLQWPMRNVVILRCK